MLTLLSTKKVKNVTTDALNDRLVITYTDNTTSNLNLADIINDVYVSGATLNATTNVLTLTSSNGGADVTVNLSEFVDNDQFNNAQNAFQGYIDNINQKFTDMNDPSGFIRELPNTIGIMELSLDGVTIHKIDQNGNYTTRSDSKFASGTSFEVVATAMTFAMYPVNDTYTIYIEGTKHDISSLQTTSIANASGLQFVHHNLDGTLGSSTTFSFDYFEDMPVTSLVYINATSGNLVTFADERHGIQMDGMTHRYLHFTQGAKYISGMDIQGVTSGSKTHTNITSGIGYDEDIYIQTPQQTTSQHLYKNSTSWELVTASDSIGIINGGIAQYNYNDNGTFSLADVPTDKFVSMFFVMTNNRVSPYIKIPSQHTYSTVSDAITNINTDLNSIVLSGLSTPEFIVIGAIVLNRLGQVQEISTGVTIYDLRSVRILASGGGISSSTSIQHQDLLNIQGGVSGEYYHLTQAELTKLGNALTSETNTTLTLVGNVLTYTGENGVPVQHDLSIYLDDTNLARIISGVYDAPTHSLVFTRDDATTFSIDASMFFDDTNIVTSVNGKTGAVTIAIADISGLQTALDGKVDENTAITAGTATKITYDAKGLVTAGTSLVAGDIPTLNQNTTGTSSNITGTLAISQGGTGATTTTGTGANVLSASPTLTGVVTLIDGVELGTGDTTASTPYIDFHSGTTATDYDSRIIANGGTSSAGYGSLVYQAYGGHTFQGQINSGHIVSTGTGNDFNTGGVELVGNGAANTVFPTLGFHQPGGYASSLQLRGGADFRLYNQGASAYANLTVNNITATAFLGNATSATIATNITGSSTPIAGGFDTSATTPTATNRLNFGGYIYPTYINLTGSADSASAASHYFFESASDGFVRPKTLANVKAEIVPTYYTRGAGTAGITGVTNYALFPAAADTLTLPIGVYKITCSFYVSVATSTVSATLGFNFRGGGTAVGNIYGTARGTITNGGTPVQYSLGVALGTNVVVTAASAVAGRVHIVDINAIVDVTTAGTIIPAYQWSATLTSGVVTLSALNNLTITKLADTAVTTFGGWA